jgi:3-methyl-2-oxobutanoate hydroxymethyltransferase
MSEKLTIPQLQKLTDAGEKISMITAYDYPTALLVDRAGIEMVLVGDSVGDNMLGYPNTVPVTMDEMIHHTKAVRRGIRRAFLIGDMPFLSFQVSIEKAIENAGRFMKEGGVEAVKIEGGEEIAETLRRMVKLGIAVMGHIGFTPQREALIGRHRLQVSDEETARKVLNDAKILEEAGAFSIVLEKMPAQLAKVISHELTIPTIGIGSGPDCDGQVSVITDVLGLIPREFKHAKRYANLSEIIEQAVKAYHDEVKLGLFPTEEHSFQMKDELLQHLKQ